jgi:hypothetical protein
MLSTIICFLTQFGHWSIVLETNKIITTLYNNAMYLYNNDIVNNDLENVTNGLTFAH